MSSSSSHRATRAATTYTMPSTRSCTARTVRDSWPPTRMHLHPTIEQDDTEIEELDLSKMDHDPLGYFLSMPSSSLEVEDEEEEEEEEEEEHMMDFAMDFDAGIEDPSRPSLIVRSVSPSSLEGLDRLSSSPPRSPPTPDLDLDMLPTPRGDACYINFTHDGTHEAGLPMGFDHPGTGGMGTKSEHGRTKLCSLPSPSTFHLSTVASSRLAYATRPSTAPRALSYGPGPSHKRANAMSLRRSPRSWSLPSPDVWSIEEEEEEDAKMGTDTSMEEARQPCLGAKALPIDIPAAKPKKRVRFMLPSDEV